MHEYVQERNHYVYVCFIYSNIVYIGSGKGDRLSHCTSGTSSCVKLNKAFFEISLNAFKVKKYYKNLTEAEARLIEKSMIVWAVRDGCELYNSQKHLNANHTEYDSAYFRDVVEYERRKEEEEDIGAYHTIVNGEVWYNLDDDDYFDSSWSYSPERPI